MKQNRFFSPLDSVRQWRARRAAGALMAKAAYETLDCDEQSHLDRLRGDYPGIVEEQRKTVAFASQFQLADDALSIDLSPRIGAVLAEAQAAQRRQFRTNLYAAVAAGALLAIGLYIGVMVLDDSTFTGMPQHEGIVLVSRPAQDAAPQSEAALHQAMHQACQLVADSDAAGAAALIEQVVAARPEAARAAEALLLLADIEYSYLQRYERAYAAYDRVRISHPAVFSLSPEALVRYDLLAEARREQFAPIHALDSARNRSDEAFEALENLIVAYPNTALASTAIEEMRVLVKNTRGHRNMNIADELEMVRQRCTDPVATAQVDLTLGDLYCNMIKDRARAMAYYNRVAASDHIALANQAHVALSRME